MCETSLRVWFVCRLCRGSFGQVDAFIEHKKQNHFTQFQNTTSIVFEESEHGDHIPVIMKVENQLMDANNESPIKTEANSQHPTSPVSSEIIDEPNSGLFEFSELITYESKVNPNNEINFFGLKQPEQNPYVLLKRLTSEEIRRACVPQHQITLLKYEQHNFVTKLEPSNSSVDVDSNTTDFIKVEESTEHPPSVTVTSISTADDVQFECKLCSKQLESEAQLKIHVGICALYHKHRNRFCVTCNRKFRDTYILKRHRLRFHGTEEEKSSLYKFKCHVCLKKFRDAIVLSCHLTSHEKKIPKVGASKTKSLKCSQSNCGKEFKSYAGLRNHIDTIHLGLRPFSCHFPNCNKAFSQKGSLGIHLRIHTGERPYKCTFDNCNKAFTTSSNRSMHYRSNHYN